MKKIHLRTLIKTSVLLMISAFHCSKKLQSNYIPLCSIFKRKWPLKIIERGKKAVITSLAQSNCRKLVEEVFLQIEKAM